MRAAKMLVGWLCVLSLLGAIAFFGYSQYIPTVPYRKGATIYRLPEPDTRAIVRSLADQSNAAGDTLQRYALQEVEPVRVFKGMHAAREAGWNPEFEVVNPDRRNVAAAALLDARGRVIAAFPKDLVGSVFPFNLPISNIDDDLVKEDYSNLSYSEREWRDQGYPYWKSTFTSAVGKYARDVGDIMLAKVKNPQGETTGILAVAVNGNLMGIDLPENVQPPDRAAASVLQTLAIASLITYLILLPLWAGMDAHWRGMRPYAWASLVAITNVVGLGAYIVARLPGPYPCANCGEEILGKYVRCPACGVSLMNTCPICRTRMKPNWQYCPACNVTPTQAVEQTLPQSAAEPLVTRLMDHMRGSLCVTVIDAQSGAPMQNARITVTGRVSRVDGITNAAGVFEARKLRSGRYTVTTTRTGYEPAEAELDIGETPESIRLSLRPLPAKIIGRVVERGTTRPIAGVRVYIDSSRLDRSSITGGEGGFVLADIPAGPYTVAVDAVGFKHQTRLAEVSPGQQVTVDFAIEPSEESA